MEPIPRALLSFLFFLLVPTFVFCACPVYLIRFLVSRLQRFLRPDLSHLVPARSVVLRVDGFPSSPKWNLVVWLTLEESLDLNKFRTYFQQHFVAARSPSGQYIFPEYQQYITKWLGFYFWKWNTNFDIAKHIRKYSGPYFEDTTIDDRNLLKIITTLTAAPWAERQSPWEFLQIPNYSGDSRGKAILIFRIHHVLGDGYYILKLLMQDICGISLKMAAQPTQHIQRALLPRLLAAPSDFMEMCFKGAERDKNPWHPSTGNRWPSKAALSQRIPLDLIKGIRQTHGVSFTAVLFAAITGGIRRMMIDTGIEPQLEIHQAVAVPMAGHPGNLRNHFIFSFISLPTGLQDPLQRLQKIEENLQNLKSSFVPLLTFWAVPFIGSLFPGMMTPFTTNHLTTCLTSNFPGTPQVPTFRETRVLDMMFGAGLGPGSTGLGFTLISYVHSIRILTVIDPAILPNDADVQQLNKYIMEELQILRDSPYKNKHLL